MAMPRPIATGSHSIQRLRSASSRSRIQVRAPATPSPLFDSTQTLAYLRRAFPAEMRSKRYLGPYLLFWVTFWVTYRVKSDDFGPSCLSIRQVRCGPFSLWG